MHRPGAFRRAARAGATARVRLAGAGPFAALLGAGAVLLAGCSGPPPGLTPPPLTTYTSLAQLGTATGN